VWFFFIFIFVLNFTLRQQFISFFSNLHIAGIEDAKFSCATAPHPYIRSTVNLIFPFLIQKVLNCTLFQDLSDFST